MPTFTLRSLRGGPLQIGSGAGIASVPWPGAQVAHQFLLSIEQKLYHRRIKTVPCGRPGKAFVSGDQRGSFCEGCREVKAVIDGLIEIEGYGLSGSDITGRWKQLDRGRLERRQSGAGEVARERPAPCLRPENVGTSPRERWHIRSSADRAPRAFLAR